MTSQRNHKSFYALNEFLDLFDIEMAALLEKWIFLVLILFVSATFVELKKIVIAII